MNIPELWAEFEEEQSWRTGELRFHSNMIQRIDDSDRDQYRRAVVLMLYAHLEGFCNFGFQLFIRAINSTNIECGRMQPAITAATLNNVLIALRHPNSKCSDFRNSLPDDAKLHLFAREREFVANLEELHSKPVLIPDEVVDLESNVKPVVLKKNMYKLGLPYEVFAEMEGDISHLLEIRNKIAHGEQRMGVTDTVYERLRAAVFRIMDIIKTEIMRFITNKQYLR